MPSRHQSDRSASIKLLARLRVETVLVNSSQWDAARLRLIKLLPRMEVFHKSKYNNVFTNYI